MNDHQQQRTLHIIQSFREVNQVFHKLLTKIAGELDLTPIQYIVLKMLADRPSMMQSELAACLYVSASTTSGVIDRMVAANLVSRERSSTDRRSVSIKLLAEGKRKLQLIQERQLEHFAPLQDMVQDQLDDLLRTQAQIVQILHKELEEHTYYE
ncbi:MarR family transcriptional regulator [Paenibacillus oryzisoli]|uniref:MarR family winged helix-turn-helix transcriptional regulator n=1 Tax=Paenibacillus oryzisoli TaxID=1850517 RepID=UPI003D2BFB39